MRHLPRHIVLLACLSMSVEARMRAQPNAAATVTIPDTPAGKRLSTWLTAFNNADREGLAAFVASFAASPAPTVEGALGLRERSGGFDIRKVEESSETRITVLLQQRSGDQYARAVIEVDATPDHRIVSAPIRAIPTPAEYSAPRLSDAALAQQLGTHLKSLEASEGFSGTVLIMKNGRPVFNGAYGYADWERKLRNDMDTKFRFGSMGKMFTATAVVQLIQARKIALTDPVGKFLPGYPNRDVAQKVTIEHLLSHTGGTGDIFTPEFQSKAASLKTLQDYVDLLGQGALRFEPGARYEYSNFGYVLLGRIIEVASGEDYYDYLDRHLFRPAGMTSTGFWRESEPLPGRVIGYAPGAQGYAPAPALPTDRASPAGGGISTAGDMVLFAHALLDHKLLDAQHTELMMTGRVPMGPGLKYAFGFRDAAPGTPQHRVGHNGGAPGQSGDLLIYPETGYVVVVLSNFGPPAAQRVSDHIASRIGG